MQLLHVGLHGSAGVLVPCHVHKHGGRVGTLIALVRAGQKRRRDPHDLGAHSLQQGRSAVTQTAWTLLGREAL